MLKDFIKDYLEKDTSRSNKSNLIKLLTSDTEKYQEVNNFISFGTFKQKLYHFIKNDVSKPTCLICNGLVNWVEKDFRYRETCSSHCSGKLNLYRKDASISYHPQLKTKEEYYSYFTSGKIKITESSISKNYPNLLSKIKTILFVDDFNQKIYCYLKDISEKPHCKNCKVNEVSFENFSKGFRDFCSIRCSSNSDEKKNSIKKTILEKYKCSNVSQFTRIKALDTMVKRYGEHISKTDFFKDKFKKTSLERYGVEHPFQSNEFKEKSKKTCLEKYGVENAMRSVEIINKNLETKKQKGQIFKWSEEQLKSYENYRRKVTYLSEKSYQQNKSLINPDNLERGHVTYHLDHIYPVILGFINQVDAELISHHKNLQILPHEVNRAKNDNTDMTLEDFFSLINS